MTKGFLLYWCRSLERLEVIQAAEEHHQVARKVLGIWEEAVISTKYGQAKDA